MIENTLIPGIVAIVGGIVLLKERKKFILGVKKAHEEFWNGTIGLKSHFGKSSEILATTLITIIGVGCLLAGAILISRFIL